MSDHYVREYAVDCGRVLAPVFAAKGWLWGDSVPDAAQIALTACDLLTRVKLDTTLSTGRLMAYRYVEDGDEVLSLSLDLGSLYPDGDVI